jgi:hypothetical protein
VPEADVLERRRHGIAHFREASSAKS